MAKRRNAASAKRPLSRRAFLHNAATKAAAFSIVPRFVLGGAGYTPPSEQLTRAIIGLGTMGRMHLKYPGARLVALCDVDQHHLSDALAKSPKGVRGYADFRDVLARDDVDVVHIVTPPHWHAAMSIAAAEAGKDIWCEKPMTRTIGEGRRVIETVRRYGRIFRVNTWFRFKDPFYRFGTTVAPIKKLVDSGLLGWPLRVTVSKATGFDWKFFWTGEPHLTPQPVPKHLDYDRWLGPAPYKPYNSERVHEKFRGYWDYDGGGLGDMGQHYLDPVQYILGKDETSPVRVEVDAPQQHPDAVGVFRRITLRYADGCEIVLDGEGTDTDASYIEGPNGKLWPDFRSDIPDLERKLAAFPDPAPQETDFYECVRARRVFSLNESVAHRSCTLINLGKIALRLGRSLDFDSVNQRFTSDEQANRLIDQPMRAPWRL